MKWVCARCGAEYSADWYDLWGVDGRGDGYGPTPCCTALRQDARGAGYACRGPLIPRVEPAPAPASGR